MFSQGQAQPRPSQKPQCERSQNSPQDQRAVCKTLSAAVPAYSAVEFDESGFLHCLSSLLSLLLGIIYRLSASRNILGYLILLGHRPPHFSRQLPIVYGGRLA